MTFLPVVERELRVASRRRATYWLRSILGLGMVLLWFFMLIVGQRSLSTFDMGQMLFITTGILALGFCILAGVFLTADCLSEEKREGTLGLLFLTELNGFDVVLGKMLATSLHAIYGVLTVFPLLALPLVIGGVTAGEFWRVTLVLLVTLLFSLSLGLLISALTRETRQALTATLLVLIFLTGVMPALYWLLFLLLKGRSWEALLWPSPVFLYSHAFGAYFRFRGAPEFWHSLLTMVCLGGGALVGACLYLPRAWREKGEDTGARQTSGWGRRLRFGSAAFRSAQRSQLEWDPFYWLASRDRLPRWLACGIIGALLPIWFCFLAGAFFKNTATRGMCFAVSLFMAFGLHQVLKYLVAVEASRRLSDDRHSGALELLLVTPLSIGQILEGQRRALRGLFGVPILLILSTNIGLLFVIFGTSLFNPGPVEERSLFSEMCLGGALMLLVDFYAMSWVGMWMALRTKRHHRAVLATLGRILLVPWLGMFCAFFAQIGSRTGSGSMETLFWFWYLFGVVLDLILVARARTGLRNSLRDASTQPALGPALTLAGVPWTDAAPVRTTKRCDYCGKQTDEATPLCSGCGTAFPIGTLAFPEPRLPAISHPSDDLPAHRDP